MSRLLPLMIILISVSLWSNTVVAHGGWETWRSVDHNQWNENHVVVVLGLLNNQAQPCRSFCRHLHLLLPPVEALEPSGQLCL